MGNLREHKGQTYLTYLLCESRTPAYAIVFISSPAYGRIFFKYPKF